MKLDLDDFSMLHEIEQEKSEQEEKTLNKEEIERFYQEKIAKLENQYKELISKVSKESYEQGFSDAKLQMQKELEERVGKIAQDLEKRKNEEVAKLQENYLSFEETFEKRYNQFLQKFTDIVVDSLTEVLEFLYIDTKNGPKVQEALQKLVEDFSNYLPLRILVSKKMYQDIKKRFSHIEVKKSEELQNNEFIIEFHDFKIENKIKEKLSVIKDEIKRETKKLT